MKQLSIYFLVWVLAIVFLAKLSEKYQGEGTPVVRTLDVPELSGFDQEYKRARTAFLAEDFLQTLTILNKTEGKLLRERNIPASFSLGFYHLKGAAHWSLWQYADAEHAWLAAAEFAESNRDKNRIRDLLSQTHRVLEQVNTERNKRKVYLASPGVGPSSYLTGKVVLIYIFIEDSDSSGWSLRNRTHALNTWQSAQEWMTSQASHYGSGLSFTKRIFMLDKLAAVKRLKIGDISQNFRHADTVVKMAASHFGYKNILSFANAIKKEEKADQAILLFHLGKDGRSFASRCMKRCGELGEFVFLMESTRAKRWQSLEYAQAHESMHLFGADDLYNISNAKDYATTDIMNYPSRMLRGSTLEDITAFAVGLKNRPPRTPFKIRKYSSRGE